MADLEAPTEYITLARAGELCAVDPGTLGNQARSGRLRTVLLGHTRVTTRLWLHDYLTARSTHQGRRKSLPDGYQSPEPPNG